MSDSRTLDDRWRYRRATHTHTLWNPVSRPALAFFRSSAAVISVLIWRKQHESRESRRNEFSCIRNYELKKTKGFLVFQWNFPILFDGCLWQWKTFVVCGETTHSLLAPLMGKRWRPRVPGNGTRRVVQSGCQWRRKQYRCCYVLFSSGSHARPFIHFYFPFHLIVADQLSFGNKKRSRSRLVRDDSRFRTSHTMT